MSDRLFPQLIRRVRAARSGPAYPPRVCLWLDDGDDPAAKIEAEHAAGRIGPSTEVLMYQWCEADSDAGSTMTTPMPTPAERVAACMKELGLPAIRNINDVVT